MELKRRRDLVTRVIEGETVILDRMAEKVHRLNATASYIWTVCDGHTAHDITASLLLQFDAPAETVLRDVDATLSEFRRLGLVSETLGGSGSTNHGVGE